MNIKHYGLFAIVLLLVASCNSNMKKSKLKASKFEAPPVAVKDDSVLTIHGDTRVDPYFWMRLTDEQKLAEQPDVQTQKVIAAG